MSIWGPLKRGRRRGKKLFWGYYTDGKEMWVSEEKFEAATLKVKLGWMQTSEERLTEKLKNKRATICEIKLKLNEKA